MSTPWRGRAATETIPTRLVGLSGAQIDRDLLGEISRVVFWPWVANQLRVRPGRSVLRLPVFGRQIDDHFAIRRGRDRHPDGESHPLSAPLQSSLQKLWRECDRISLEGVFATLHKRPPSRQGIFQALLRRRVKSRNIGGRKTRGLVTIPSLGRP